MKAKFINESSPMRTKKYAMRQIDLDPELKAEYGVPDWALNWNGWDIPEAAVYVDDRLEVGDVVANDVDGEPVLVIYKDENGTFATRAINKQQEGDLDESVYTSGELTDNEYLDDLYAQKDMLLNTMEDAQELGYSGENIRMIAQELAEIEEKIKWENIEMDELRGE